MHTYKIIIIKIDLMGSECSPSECDIRLHQITRPNEISSPNLLWFSLSSNAKFWHLHLWTYTTPAELQFTQILIYATWLCFLTSYSIFGWLVLRFSSLYSYVKMQPQLWPHPTLVIMIWTILDSYYNASTQVIEKFYSHIPM